MNIIFKLLNSLFLKVQKNRTLAFLIAASLSWLVSVYAFSFDGFQKWDIVEGLVLFFADMPDGDNGWIITGKLLWMITLAAAIVFVALKDFLYQLTIKSIANSLEKHIVVCGNNNLDISKRFGVDVDSQISEDQVEEMQQFNSLLSNTINLKQHAIVISDSGMTDEALSQYSSQGIYFVNADNSPETWNKAGIETCDFVIVSDESDSKNIAVANRINEYLKKENKVKIYTNVEDYITMSVASNKDNISFFNNSLTATRKLFQSKCLTTGVNTFDKNKEQVHLLVIGFGNYGQSVALEAIKLGHFYNGNSLKITIVDQSKTAFDAFKKYYNYESIAALELEFVLMNVESKDFDQRILDNFDATYVAICLSDDNTTQLILQDMAAKLHQNESLDGKHIPFAVRIKEDDDLRCNYESIDILKFEQTTIKDIKGVDLNDKAQDLHEMYGGIWEGLSFHEKDKNYAPADHEIIKTAVIKKLIQEYGQEEVKEAVSLQEQKDKQGKQDKHYKFNELSDMQQKMIDMEHRRWNAYHYINGWKSKDIYDKKPEHKLHPCLINTSDLENLTKAKDLKIDYYVEDIKSWKITFDRLIGANTKSQPA
jgi:voltage-gated potassium channel Kch